MKNYGRSNSRRHGFSLLTQMHALPADALFQGGTTEIISWVWTTDGSPRSRALETSMLVAGRAGWPPARCRQCQSCPHCGGIACFGPAMTLASWKFLQNSPYKDRALF